MRKPNRTNILKTYIWENLLALIPQPLEDDVALAVRVVSCGNSAVHLERPAKDVIDLHDLEGEDLQADPFFLSIVGKYLSGCPMREVHRADCGCTTKSVELKC